MGVLVIYKKPHRHVAMPVAYGQPDGVVRIDKVHGGLIQVELDNEGNASEDVQAVTIPLPFQIAFQDRGDVTGKE